MANFDTYAPKLKKWEGGWSDNPADAGGATMMGVTLATYRSYYGSWRTKQDLYRITDTQWTLIMKTGYWDKCRADEIQNQSVAELLVDWCVNAGTKTPVKALQRVLNCTADGIVGKNTLRALNGGKSAEIHQRLLTARIQFYYDLVDKKPSNKVFLRGWLNRCYDFIYEP